jgi:hypothetical protein
MGWKTINGHEYYYRSRRVGGRVVSEYVGKGDSGAVFAALAALDAEDKEDERRHRRQEVEHDRALDRVVAEARDLAVAVLKAAGFHQHKGEWRKRRMSTDLAKTEAPSPPPSVPAPVTRRREFGHIVDNWLLYEVVEATVSKEGKNRESIAKEIRERAGELAGPNPTPADVLAAEATALAWYAMRISEAKDIASKGTRTIQQADHAMRRVEHATRRLHAGLRTLALLRKLNRPAVQVVNIGQNQNIATMPAPLPA